MRQPVLQKSVYRRVYSARIFKWRQVAGLRKEHEVAPSNRCSETL